ncbi:MAG: type II secretion system minor pseudopilin GspJ [Ruminobacter sp.]|uniref:Type II secretion system protein J n=1 Tax=Ruminobacter amylophilus TaxID=867 RepID=A0A662ZF38_9GAMM|nr:MULTISPECIES: type II secretion system minor pseudopilin GspJ [Ruminobacter]MBQ3776452.1 type II secretion system minor pseudopilin GspJ [Ruminobacter sp.]SFP12293.1 general secretion pathway protein J [Ruminobacter amylophilus]
MRRFQAFTLIEVLLSIVIMAILAQATYKIITGVINADSVVEENSARFVELQKAFSVVDRDFSQAVPRQFRYDGSSSKIIIEVGENKYQSDGVGVSFSVGGSLNPGAMLPRGEITRVWYRLKNKELQRATYPFPDTVVGFEPEFEPVLSGVNSFKLNFYKSGSWTKDWQNKMSLPGGFKIEIELEDYGKIEKTIYVIAGEH